VCRVRNCTSRVCKGHVAIEAVYDSDGGVVVALRVCANNGMRHSSCHAFMIIFWVRHAVVGPWDDRVIYVG
jgi:hypothetical protein